MAICMTSWARPCWLYVLRAPPTVGGEPPTIGGNHPQRPQFSPPTPPTPHPKLLGVYPKRLGVLTPTLGVVDLRRRGAEGLGLDSTLLPRHPRGGRSGPEVDRKWTTLVPFRSTSGPRSFRSTSSPFRSTSVTYLVPFILDSGGRLIDS